MECLLRTAIQLGSESDEGVLILILMECLLRLYKSVNYKSILISVFITY